MTIEKVENKYKELAAMMSALQHFITNFVCANEELAAKFDKVRSNQRSVLDLMVSQAGKTMKVDVGDEQLSDTDVATTRFSPHELVRRSTAKKLAKKLLQRYHPDKADTGNAVLFNIVRRASKDGDVELINLYLHKEGFEADSLDHVYSAVHSRVEKLKGTPLMVCARMFMSNSETAFKQTSFVLDRLIYTSNPFKEN